MAVSDSFPGPSTGIVVAGNGGSTAVEAEGRASSSTTSFQAFRLGTLPCRPLACPDSTRLPFWTLRPSAAVRLSGLLPASPSPGSVAAASAEESLASSFGRENKSAIRRREDLLGDFCASGEPVPSRRLPLTLSAFQGISILRCVSCQKSMFGAEKHMVRTRVRRCGSGCSWRQIAVGEHGVSVRRR